MGMMNFSPERQCCNVSAWVFSTLRKSILVRLDGHSLNKKHSDETSTFSDGDEKSTADLFQLSHELFFANDSLIRPCRLTVVLKIEAHKGKGAVCVCG